MRRIAAARAHGWPEASGAVWLIEAKQRLAGSLAPTKEADDVGQVRWFVLEPDLRGHGLGGRLMAELLAEARRAGIGKLVLDPFSELRTASHIY